MKYKHLVYSFVVTALVVLSAACTSSFDKLIKGNDQELKYKKALEYYENGKYGRAAQLFDNILLYFRGSQRDDSVNFFLAKSYYLDGDVMSSAHFFDQFRQTFPRSKFTEEAYYLRCVSLYGMTYRSSLDPKPSNQALAAMNEFIYLYPSNQWLKETQEMQDDLLGRLDEKAYNSAALYYKIEDYKAAIMALKTSLKDNPGTRYREEILYLIMASSYQLAKHSVPAKQRDRYQAVIDEYYNIAGEYPESKYKNEVNDMHRKALDFLAQ